MLEREVEVLKSTISQTKEQYDIISREKNAILQEIQNVSKKLTQVEVNFITVADHKNRFQDTANEVEKSTQEISFIIEKIEKEFDQRTNRCKYIEDQFEAERKNNSNLNKDNEDLCRKTDTIAQSISSLEMDKKKLTQDTAIWQSRYDEIEKQSKDHKQERQETEKVLEESNRKIQNYESKVTQIETKYTEATQTITELQSRIESITREQSELKNEISDEKNRTRDSKKDFDRHIREHKRTAEQQVKTIQEKDLVVEEMKSKKVALENDANQLRKEMQKLKEDLKKILREKDQAKSEHKDAVRMIGEMQTSYEEMKRTKIEIESDSKTKIEMFTKEIRVHQEKQGKLENELKNSLELQQSDADDRYKRVQEELQREREVARKDIYQKQNDLEKTKQESETHKSEVVRMKKHCESLEIEIKKLSSQSQHTSSMLVLQKDDQQRSEARIDMGAEQKSASSFQMTTGQTTAQSMSSSTTTTTTRKEQKTESYSASRRGSRRESETYSGSKAPSRSGSRPSSRPSSRGTSRAVSPAPYEYEEQSATDEDDELRRILEESRSRRSKFT